MKLSVPLSLGLVALTGSGCFFHWHRHPVVPRGQDGTSQTGSPATLPAPIVTPGSSMTGSVASYNAIGRFVVVGFGAGQVPTIGRSLFLYRNGLKVAEIKVTGPQRDTYTVADVVTGDAQPGDEVRDQ